LTVDEKVTALVVTQDNEKLARLRTEFSTISGFDVRVEQASFDDCVVKLREVGADVAVLFLDEQRGNGCLTLEQLKKSREQIFAFAVSSERSAEVIVKAIRAGADELLSAMPNAEELLKALVRVAERRKRMVASGELTSKVIAVHSPHGGVGVTTMAVNLAVGIRRQSGQEVCLVDLDLQYGETPVFLDFKPLYTVLDVCQGIANLDASFMKGALYTHSSGIQVLPAPTNLEDSEAVTAAAFEKILDTLRQMFSYIVIDTSAHLSETTLIAIEQSDSVYILTDNMVASVRAVQRSLDTMMRLGIDPAGFQFVLNRPVGRSEIKAKDVAEALKFDIGYSFPVDEATCIAAANQGVPLHKVNSRSPLVEAISAIAKTEVGDGTPQQQSSRGLFGRLFSEARV
jgi:pilus assembly protein CpaE